MAPGLDGLGFDGGGKTTTWDGPDTRGMTYDEQTIGEFLDGVASREVTPAGGTSAALVGAIGTALCEMVCLHTIGRDEYADVAAEMADVRDDLRTRRELLLDLADRDAEVVEDLLGTADGSDPTAARKRATGVPLAIAEACLPVLEHAAVLTETGNSNAAPDAGTGSFLVRSALEASLFTVRYNLVGISDPSFVEEMETRATDLERSAEAEFERAVANLGSDT